MDYQDNMAGLDQLFQALLLQQQQPTQATVDEMDETFKKQDETAQTIERWLSGQSSPSQQRQKAMDLWNETPTDPDKR